MNESAKVIVTMLRFSLLSELHIFAISDYESDILWWCTRTCPI